MDALLPLGGGLRRFRRAAAAAAAPPQHPRRIPGLLVGTLLLATQLHLWVLHLRFSSSKKYDESAAVVPDDDDEEVVVGPSSSSILFVVPTNHHNNRTAAPPPPPTDMTYEPWIWNSSNLLLPASGICRRSADETTGTSLRDGTTVLSPCRIRPWIKPPQEERSDMDDPASTTTAPHVKILLTSYGWNHPNQTIGRTFGRSQRQQELLQAVVDHPLFDPAGWDELINNSSTIQPNVRYYVFLDVETCFEANYPTYLGGVKANADLRFGRRAPSISSDNCVWLPKCDPLKRAMSTSLFQSTSGAQATLVYVECRGNGQPSWFYRRRNRAVHNPNPGVSFDDQKVSIASLSSSTDQLDPDRDMGLPPPAVSRLELSDTQVQAIKSCRAETDRQLLLVFVGQIREDTPRRDLVGLHNVSQRVVSMESAEFRRVFPTRDANQLLTHAAFGAAPRGHNLFSYRFTEVLSAGAIPVVHSDNWVLPFRSELVDWSECAVVIAEIDVNRTIDILQAIPVERRCQMRQRCYEIYQLYMKTPSGTIDGILQGLELLAMKQRN